MLIQISAHIPFCETLALSNVSSVSGIMAQIAALPVVSAESGRGLYLAYIRRFPMLEPEDGGEDRYGAWIRPAMSGECDDHTQGRYRLRRCRRLIGAHRAGALTTRKRTHSSLEH